MMPSRQRLRVITKYSERYVLRLHLRETRDFALAADGRVTLEVPAQRGAWSLYLFNIKVSGGYDPAKAKTVDVVRAGRPVRELSLAQIAALPFDADGYRMLTILSK